MDDNLKREIILQHYADTTHRHASDEEKYLKVNTANSSCIDNLDIYIDIEDNIIKDISFTGEACAISISSTSIMIDNLIGKTVDEALDYIDNFYHMINNEEYNKDILNEAIVYDEIYKQSNRRNCAYLPYKGIKQILESFKK